MHTLLLIVHILACMALILIVLLQKGRGADMGAAFGGASQTLFGSTGGTTFMGKLTTMAAIVFMLTCLGLTYFSGRPASVSIMKDAQAPAGPSIPEAKPIAPPDASQAPQTAPGAAANSAEKEVPATGQPSQPADKEATPKKEATPPSAQKQSATTGEATQPAPEEEKPASAVQQPAVQPSAQPTGTPAASGNSPESAVEAKPGTTASEPAQPAAPVEGQGSAAPEMAQKTSAAQISKEDACQRPSDLL